MERERESVENIDQEDSPEEIKKTSIQKTYVWITKGGAKDFPLAFFGGVFFWLIKNSHKIPATNK